MRREVPVARFIDAIKAELVTVPEAERENEISTLYLGGGTPSKLGAAGIAELIGTVAEVYPKVTAGSTEITIEANPEDISEGNASAWVAAGVRRVSLGTQSFEPRVLDWMHRGHDLAIVRRAVDNLRSASVRDISLDLIFALPERLGRDWEADLDSALDLDPQHLSLYGLTVEPATPLGRWTARGEVVEAPEERYADEFRTAHERLTDAGFEHYEVSNYARPGFRSQHNSAYWRRVPYRGLGPSAHSFDGTRRRWNIREYERWAQSVLGGGRAEEGLEELNAENRLAEEVYLGLRTSDGLAISRSDLAAVEPWISAGWGDVDAEMRGEGAGERLKLTAEGWLRLDALAAALTAHRSR